MQFVRQRIQGHPNDPAHLINHSQTDGFYWHYWHDRKDEVDFVIEKKQRIIGQEVSTCATHARSGI
jgi:predicted AAA+ superfamily ATPase